MFRTITLMSTLTQCSYVLKVTNIINWYGTVGYHLGYQCNYKIIVIGNNILYDATLVSDIFFLPFGCYTKRGSTLPSCF